MDERDYAAMNEGKKVHLHEECNAIVIAKLDSLISQYRARLAAHQIVNIDTTLDDLAALNRVKTILQNENLSS
jgi:hypothetical protein